LAVRERQINGCIRVSTRQTSGNWHVTIGGITSLRPISVAAVFSRAVGAGLNNKLAASRHVRERGFEKRAAEIERRLPLEFYLESGKPSEPRAVSIAEKAAGCGCSCIDQPIWNDQTWTIKPVFARAIADAIAMLGGSAPFTFRAAWLGPDQPVATREELSVTALTEKLKAGTIVPARSYFASTGG
jgi:hypothetical protein